MSTEQKATEQNALAARLSGFWGNFKQGKIISYKWMAILLVLVAAIGVTWYIFVRTDGPRPRKRWVELDEAKLGEAQKRSRRSIPARFRTSWHDSRSPALYWATTASTSSTQCDARTTADTKAVANIEKAREMFQQAPRRLQERPGVQAGVFARAREGRSRPGRRPVDPRPTDRVQGEGAQGRSSISTSWPTAARRTLPGQPTRRKWPTSLRRREIALSANSSRSNVHARTHAAGPEIPKGDGPRTA